MTPSDFENFCTKGQTGEARLFEGDVDQILPSEPDCTALLLASTNGHNELCAMLVREMGADVNLRTGPIQISALDRAVRSNQTSTVSLLVSLGANPNGTDRVGRTPLAHARAPEVAKGLVELGTDPNAQLPSWGFPMWSEHTQPGVLVAICEGGWNAGVEADVWSHWPSSSMEGRAEGAEWLRLRSSL